MIEGAALLFIVGLLVTIGYALIVVKIKKPYLRLLATLVYLIYFAPYGFAVEYIGQRFGTYGNEFGKLLGIIIAVVAGGLISIALSEIRARHLTSEITRTQ